MAILAEALVEGRAPSSGAGRTNKDATKERIRSALEYVEENGPFPYDGKVSLEVIFFDTERVPGDMDNKLKTIQDAMNLFVYEDDKLIDELNLKRIVRNENNTFNVDNPAILDGYMMNGPAFYICVRKL